MVVIVTVPQPHWALLQNTKYRVSNITQTLILASSPLIDLTKDREGPRIQYGSPPDLTDQKDDDNDTFLARDSTIHEVRVKAPTNRGSNRNPKAIHNSYFEYENQNFRYRGLPLHWSKESNNILIIGRDLTTSTRSRCTMLTPSQGSSRKHLMPFLGFSLTPFILRSPPMSAKCRTSRKITCRANQT